MTAEIAKSTSASAKKRTKDLRISAKTRPRLPQRHQRKWASVKISMIIKRSSPPALLMMHSGIAVLYMLELKPVSLSGKPFLRTEKNKYAMTVVVFQKDQRHVRLPL